jgi:hypothetical protein
MDERFRWDLEAASAAGRELRDCGRRPVTGGSIRRIGQELLSRRSKVEVRSSKVWEAGEMQRWESGSGRVTTKIKVWIVN